MLSLVVLVLVSGVLAGAGRAYAFGEVFQVTGSGKTTHFEGGSFTPAPETSVNAGLASAFIAGSLDPGGKAYICWQDSTTMLADVDPSFPDPVSFNGLLSSLGGFMVFSSTDGRAVMYSGTVSFKPSQTITRVSGDLSVLTGELQSPSAFDHFFKGRVQTAKLMSTGGCGSMEE
ncbi:MAG: hypothetical protein A2Y95_12600 [Deltaproteobacteria bacterium RBG_13_65_10]|nr:MAG: hypothetical protein A2Y95_12600 [Deltaproteobacteria bacterium RBG_13_65_10]